MTDVWTRGSAAGQQQDRQAGPEAGRLQEAGRGTGSVRVAGVPPERLHPRERTANKDRRAPARV